MFRRIALFFAKISAAVCAGYVAGTIMVVATFATLSVFAQIPGVQPSLLMSGFSCSATGTVSVTTVGSNQVFDFTGTGSLICTGSGLADVLAVGAGGSGGPGNQGNGSGGSAGGGECRNNTALLISGTNAVSVGTGGVSQAFNSSTRGTDGGDSSLGSFNAKGGGAGGAAAGTTQKNGNGGGSGGGGGGDLGAGGTGGTASPYGGLGNNGTAGVTDGGVGGGCAAAGSGLNGGAGQNYSLTGSSICFGGGGYSTQNGTGTAGTDGCATRAANTGQGGRGGQNLGPGTPAGGENGFDGRVIVSIPL